MYFINPGTEGEEKRPFGLNEEQLVYTQMLATGITNILGQAEKNKGFYFLTAYQAVRDRTEHAIIPPCLSETKLADAEGRIETTKSQYFTACICRAFPEIQLSI